MRLITDTPTLRQLCTKAATAEFVALDTEFFRERTYWPQLCLVQLAWPDAGAGAEAVAIDPLAPGMDLAPLWALLARPDLIKVLHSARQDIEIFVHLTGQVPMPLFDTQVAASVLGYRDSVGYERLVREALGHEVDKAARYADWTVRPLPERQLAYALDDVIHLRELYPLLRAQLAARGRTDWLAEEMDILCDTATYRVEPGQAVRRLRLRAGNAGFLGAARALASWREDTAQALDLPRGRVLRDEVLTRLAAECSRGPVDPAALAPHLPRAVAHEAAALAEAIRIARKTPPASDETEDSLPDAPEGLAELLRVLLRARCAAEEVAEKMVANSHDLERLAVYGAAAGVACLHGWRHDLFGADALRLVEGRAGLVFAPDTRSVQLYAVGDEEATEEAEKEKEKPGASL
jgi:ribonuclease D